MSRRTESKEAEVELKTDSQDHFDDPFDDLDQLSGAELLKWWTRRLRTVLKIAGSELPFYQRKFSAAGFDPGHFRSLDDLSRVPISTKSDLLAAQGSVTNREAGIERGAAGPRSSVTLSLSSGTAGTTFITHTARWRKLQGMSSARAHWWAGMREGGSFLLSAPAWHSYAAIQPFITTRFKMKCVVISGTYLPRFADRIVDAILNFRPRFVTMFLPMVFSTLTAGRARGLSGNQLFAGVENLVVTGAPITPGMRSHLKQLTNVNRVAEIAGSSENLLAVDCNEADGLHLVPDTCYADVLDPDSRLPVEEGERGSLVHSSVIPEGSLYIQYDGGDVAVIKRTPCRCGLPSPRIKILGRWEDRFSLGDKTMLPYDVQFALEQEMPELAGAALVITREGLQEGKLRLLLVEPEHAGRAMYEEAGARVSRRLDLPVEIVPVRDLPLRFKGVPPILSEAEARSAL
jgi:phenylacetate-CoA ligase